MNHKPILGLPWVYLGPKDKDVEKADTIRSATDWDVEKADTIRSATGWEVVNCDSEFGCVYEPDAEYIVHAANAYPKLVELLQEFAAGEAMNLDARGLLIELGEDYD